LRRKRTTTSTMQCIYSSVSKASLQKTGVLLNRLETFGSFRRKSSKMTQLETFNNQKSPSLAGLFATKEGNSLKRGMPGRTSEDSNSHIPDWEKPFDMSAEFRRFTRNPGSETFAATSCARGPTRLRHSRSSSNCRHMVNWLSATAAGVYVRGSGDSYDLVATNF
jgi:hypothetical protein